MRCLLPWTHHSFFYAYIRVEISKSPISSAIKLSFANGGPGLKLDFLQAIAQFAGHNHIQRKFFDLRKKYRDSYLLVE